MEKKHLFRAFLFLFVYSLHAQDFIKHTIDNSLSFARGQELVDLNDDNNIDVVVVSRDTGEILCWFGDGAGNFGPKTIIMDNIGGDNLGNDVSTININGDVYPDILSVTNFLFPGTSIYVPRLAYWINNGDGTFQTAVQLDDYGVSCKGILAADLNNDTHDDIVASGGVWTLEKTAYWLNDTMGGFGSRTAIYNGGSTRGQLLMDLNGDTFLDYIVSSIGAGTGTNVISYLNNQDGTFGTETIIDGNHPSANFMDSGLIDNDNIEDLIVSGINVISGDPSIIWYKGEGDGTFSTRNVITTVDINFEEIKLGDIDNDGDPDIAVTSFSDNQIYWYTNDGNGNFGSENLVDNTLNIGYAIDIADVNNDGKLDLVATDADGVYWYENDMLLSTTEFEEPDSVTIYPNPNNGSFQIEMPSENLLLDKVEILDITGRLIKREDNLNSHFIELDISDSKSGVYLVRVLSGEKSVIKKIVKH
ncbi:MAG: T9SS type A sorting domain-containing protein [Flavobacteriaceae bacterium]|nr:T9SS type A sorting domain-containing protein [Flavobacteriaceae bacterium]